MRREVSIDVDGVSRRVLSIQESRNSGDLTVSGPSGGGFRGALEFDSLTRGFDEKFTPSSSKTSIHVSPHSPTKTVIKRTVVSQVAQMETFYETTALKIDDLFAPILFKICGDLRRPRHDLSKRRGAKEAISLGSYRPERDQLRFMLVLSRPEKVFPVRDDHPSNDLSMVFERFRITLIWSFLNLPSHPHAVVFQPETAKGKPSRGSTWESIYNSYTDWNRIATESYFRVYGEQSAPYKVDRSAGQ